MARWVVGIVPALLVACGDPGVGPAESLDAGSVDGGDAGGESWALPDAACDWAAPEPPWAAQCRRSPDQCGEDVAVGCSETCRSECLRQAGGFGSTCLAVSCWEWAAWCAWPEAVIRGCASGNGTGWGL